MKEDKNKIDYPKVLRDVAQSMVRLKHPERLLKMITRFIDSEVGLSHTSMVVLDEKKHRFIFVDSKGSRRFPVGFLKFDLDHSLVVWFQEVKKKIGIEEDFLHLPTVKKWCHEVKKGSLSEAQAGEFEKIRRAMANFKAELIIPGYYKKTLSGLLILGKKTNDRPFTSSDISFFQILTQDCSMAIKNAQYYQDLVAQNEELAHRIREIENLRKKEQETYYQIMRAFAQQVHAKDPYTFGHVREVETLGLMTAKEMKVDLSGRRRDILSAALILHDVGKVGIPDQILKKADLLSDAERLVMRTHVEKGVKILEPLKDFREAAEIIRCHHENFNGSGYPRGLRGDEIPIEARIVSVVDAFHAIVSARNYDASRPSEFAFEELRRCAGTQFDPQVVEAFIRALQREIKKKGVNFFLRETEKKPAVSR